MPKIHAAVILGVVAALAGWGYWAQGVVAGGAGGAQISDLRLQNAVAANVPGGAGSGAGGAMGSGTAPSTAGCCGQRMTIDGLPRPYTYRVSDGKTADGTPVREELQTEVYGLELVAGADLPAGQYTVQILGSENSFKGEGKRVFGAKAISGRRAPTPADPKGDPGDVTILAGSVDLYKVAGGEGRGVMIKAPVQHKGGSLLIVLDAQVDTAKFSSIEVLDVTGNRVAWIFAQDVADLLRLPDTPPVVPGPVVYKDTTAPMEARAADLVKRMTLREKVSQMQNAAPSIWRLDVPGYNYWSEGLHGVARNGYATVFPQAIGMSATFDPAALHAVGDVIATEARAKYMQQGGPGFSSGGYRGLTFWSPNINLFRDPRWGRGQETYGEDPFLTGTMGVGFIKGLQGDDPKYLKVVATAKHFAVHSGPEPLRHVFNATPPLRDFYESYLPHFEMAVKEGHVYSVMGAYNRVYGSPACASDLLLKTLLRKEWGFQGYVVSDCWAIDDIWKNHQVETDPAAASAAAVLAGCDLECGYDYGYLPLAVNEHLIGEGALDQALTRVMLSRFKLGLFDPPALVPYSKITTEDYCTPANSALALKMAHESMVLLKNDGVLPLDRGKYKKIAVVGPNAEGLLPLLGNYNGTPVAPVPALEGIREAFKGGQVEVVRGCDNAARDSQWQLVPDVCLRPSADASETGLKAEHFESDDLTGAAKTVRVEKVIDVHGNIEWSLTGVPSQGSSRWTGFFVAPADGEYKLTVMGNSTPYRLTVGGLVVTDELTVLQPTTSDAATQAAPVFDGPGEIVMKLKKGQQVPVLVESRQVAGVMDLQLEWNHGDLDLSQVAADRVKDADVIVYVGGLDGRMEAEESDVRGDFEGFKAGDRTAIELPACQDRLLKALVATGKPVVMVNMTGSAVAMPWEAEHVNAIVQAWYPGQAGGTAVADVLFGDYNPSGRLPVTFYGATKDLPEFTDYAMKGRTYRYYTGKPEWAFGYGLSYTTFRYGAVTVDKATVAAADTVSVSVDVTNTGARDGDEVVQIYAKQDQPAAGDAQERLVGLRVSVAAGKTVKVSVPVAVERLRNWDEGKQAYVVPAGGWKLFAGASSGDLRGSAGVVVK